MNHITISVIVIQPNTYDFQIGAHYPDLLPDYLPFYLSLVILVFCNSIKLSTQELLEIDRTNKLNHTIDKTSGLIL